MARPLTERLPAVLTALAIQGGIFALLALSLMVVRQLPAEKETILVLPPLPRPVPTPAMVIDGRPRLPLRPSAMPPSAPALLPSSAPPASDGTAAILHDLGALTSGGKQPNAGTTKRDPRDVVSPDSHVRDESYWAAEREAVQTPPRVPCVSLADRTVGMGPAQSKEQAVMVNPLCVIAELANWGDSGKPQYERPPFDPDAGHASDADFQNALAAWQARQQTLYPHAPATPTGAAP